jgi:hypothetical protein
LPSSVHDVPLATFPSAGQAVEVPVQFSATSHSPAAGRQTVVAGWKTSAGHVSLAPVQVSAASQTSTAGRQTSPAERNSQVAVQHDVLAPLSGPSSHSSVPFTTPSPQ